MSFRTILESTPLFELKKYHTELPQDAVAFVGSPRKHPYDSEKFLLFCDISTENFTILEFQFADTLHIDELPTPFNEQGEGYQMSRVWVRRGSFGLRYDPFEVAEPPRFVKTSSTLHQKILSSLKHPQ